MRALRAFFVALLTAVAGCILAFPIGDYLTRLAQVSDFEGGRGYMLIFVCAPIGIVVGFIVGIVSSLLIHRRGTSGFFIALSWSLLTACIFAGLLVAVPYALSDKPPRIHGKRLQLQFQVRAPATVKIPDQPDGYSIRVGLYIDGRESRFAFIDWNSITRDSEHVTISGNVPLLTHSRSRSLLALIGNTVEASQFIELELPSNPREQDEKWSDWIVAKERADLSPVPESERFSARYRVQSIED